MSVFQGHCRISLAGEDCNRWLRRYPEAPVFRSGCFTLHRDLPLGLGASLLIVPSFSPGFVVLNVPFDEIRGDRTGGIASGIANLFWGKIRDAILKNATRALMARGFSPDTLHVDLVTDRAGGKVGRILIDLERVNAWLARHWFGPGLRATIVGFQAHREALEVVLAIWLD